MGVAEQLGLQRLAAAVNNERIRLGIEIAPAVADRLRAERTIPRDDGTARMTAELDEDSGIRLLCASDSDNDHERACVRARDLLAGTDSEHRPLAALSARLLLAETLTATGRLEDAADVASPAAAECGAVGLSRLPVDCGLR
jgi:serine/threonine-protein kinase PknK